MSFLFLTSALFRQPAVAFALRTSIFYISIRSHSRMSTKKALIFLPPGHEELEFCTAVDVLRRGGVHVTIAHTEDGEGSLPVKGAHGLRMCSDTNVAQVDATCIYDAMVLPGGLMAMKEMGECAAIGELLKEQEKNGRIIAAICAAPLALKAHGIGKGKRITSYPALQKQVVDGGCYDYQSEDVVVDQNLITSRGPATALKFSITLLKELVGGEVASQVANALLLKC